MEQGSRRSAAFSAFDARARAHAGVRLPVPLPMADPVLAPSPPVLAGSADGRMGTRKGALLGSRQRATESLDSFTCTQQSRHFRLQQSHPFRTPQVFRTAAGPSRAPLRAIALAVSGALRCTGPLPHAAESILGASAGACSGRSRPSGLYCIKTVQHCTAASLQGAASSKTTVHELS